MKRILLTLITFVMLISVFSLTVFGAEQDVATINIYLGDKDEATVLTKVTYKLNGEIISEDIDDTVKASIVKIGKISVPEGAKLISVTTEFGEEYSFGGGEIKNNKTYTLYKNFFHKIYTMVERGIRATFIEESRWKLFTNGLGVTLGITAGALVIGIVLGFVVAIIRSTYDTTGKLKVLSGICKVYLAVIRGTPVVIQLMIMYFIILASVRNGTISAIIAFGINSGAYVAEIVRSGIMSIDKGQFEAGRSLGFNYAQTMIYIICPQAFKNILPALGNEFIALVKETSIAGYVAIMDITKAGDTVRSVTYAPFFPLIVVAVIYLIIVLGLTKLMNMIERKLRNSDH